jgi:hypothetical protein
LHCIGGQRCIVAAASLTAFQKSQSRHCHQRSDGDSYTGEARFRATAEPLTQ